MAMSSMTCFLAVKIQDYLVSSFAQWLYLLSCIKRCLVLTVLDSNYEHSHSRLQIVEFKGASFVRLDVVEWLGVTNCFLETLVCRKEVVPRVLRRICLHLM